MASHFRVVEMYEANAFADEVEQLLNSDYQLHGQMQVLIDPNVDDPQKAKRYIQALVLKEEDQPDY